MNNSEYLKILKKFILGEQEKGASEEQIRQVLEIKHWPAAMVDVVFEEVYRETREAKFDVNKTTAVKPQTPVSLIPESNWYQATWPVGRTWMTDGDGGLPDKEPAQENQPVEEKACQAPPIPEPTPVVVSEMVPEVVPVVVSEPAPAPILETTPELVPEPALAPTPEAVVTEPVAPAMLEPVVIESEPVEKLPTEPVAAVQPAYWQPTSNVDVMPSTPPLDTVTTVNSQLVEKVARGWPAADTETKAVVAKKSANRFGYILLVTVLLVVLGLAVFYRFYYQAQPTNTPVAKDVDKAKLVIEETPAASEASETAIAITSDDETTETGELAKLEEATVTEAVLTNTVTESNKNTALGRLLR